MVAGYELGMFALVAAVMFGFAAFDVTPDDVNLVWLGLAFFAAHFAWPVGIPAVPVRRGGSGA